MQKKLIALAIATLSGTAFAQSNVTLYGQVDQYLGNFNASGNDGRRTAGLFDGGLGQSRIGFRGVEDLGNGVKAVFNLEYGLSTDSNTSIGPARQQMLGLTGSFGTVAGGLLQTAGYDWAVKYSTLGATALDTLGNVTGTGAHAFELLRSTSRAPNAVAYVSPNLNGLTLKANYAFLNEGARNDNKVRGNAYLLSADYDNGPLSIGAVYSSANVAAAYFNPAMENPANWKIWYPDDVDPRSGTVLRDAWINQWGSSRLNEWGVGTSYNFGVASVQAAYQSAQYTNIGAKADRAYNVGVKVPVSAAGTVLAAYGRSFSGDNRGRFNNFSLAYLHSLSKRTTLYTGYTYFKRGTDRAAQIFASGSDGTLGVGGAVPAEYGKGTVNGVVIGIQHKF